MRGSGGAGSGRGEDRGIQVHCYAGHRGEETPRSFCLGADPVQVGAVLARWRSPDHRYFEVRCPAGDRYILRHHESTDRWELVRSERADGGER